MNDLGVGLSNKMIAMCFSDRHVIVSNKTIVNRNMFVSFHGHALNRIQQNHKTNTAPANKQPVISLDNGANND